MVSALNAALSFADKSETTAPSPIRWSALRLTATATRCSMKTSRGTLGDMLGDEVQGMFVLDFDGHLQKYDQMESALPNFANSTVLNNY